MPSLQPDPHPISNRGMNTFRRVFMVAWAVGATFALVETFTKERALTGEEILAATIFSIALIVVVVLLVRGPVEVLDAGDRLIVRRGDVRDEIDFANLDKVTMSPFHSGQRITLHLKQESRFGKKIHFFPLRNTSRFAPMEQWPVVVSLRQRAGQPSQVLTHVAPEGRRDP